jgi:hypothetical protein
VLLAVLPSPCESQVHGPRFYAQTKSRKEGRSSLHAFPPHRPLKRFSFCRQNSKIRGPVGKVGLKHVGFREEREWRVIYSPKRSPSTLIESSIESHEGVPQTVYRFPLDGSVSAELAPLDITRLLDRVIIGPNQYSWAMYESFVAALARAGIENAERRVVVSGIPIRS